MKGFKFGLDVHIEIFTSMAANMEEFWDTHGYDFDELDSGEDHHAPTIVNARKKRLN